MNRYEIAVIVIAIIGLLLIVGVVSNIDAIAPIERTKIGGEKVGERPTFFRIFTDKDPFGHCAWDLISKEMCYHTVNYDHIISVEKKLDYLIELHGGWEAIERESLP